MQFIEREQNKQRLDLTKLDHEQKHKTHQTEVTQTKLNKSDQSTYGIEVL